MRRSVAVAAALIAGCSQHAAQNSAASSASAVAPSALHADATRLLDAQNREVLLRGFNHLALRSDRTHPAYRVDGALTPDAQLFNLADLDDADFDAIAATGLNALRLVITWEFAQPDPPPAPFNESYFRRVDDFIEKARAHGLYVVLDFGQFGWSRAIGGNAGAPDWTVSSTCAALPQAPAGTPPQASAAAGCVFEEFWRNVGGLQDRYTDLWRFVATRYQNAPAVAVYDLFNEPYGGPFPPGVFEAAFLYPFYRSLAAAIRAVDPVHTVGFQPEVYHSIGVPTPFALPAQIDNSVYLPHEYTLAYFTQRADPAYLPVQDAVTQLYLQVADTEAGIFGTPWLMGETGWTRSNVADGVGSPVPVTQPQAPRDFARDFSADADTLGVGWLWFAYASNDAAYGVNDDAELLQRLSRPYPRAIAGHVESFSFDPDTRTYSQSSSGRFDADSEIALPLAAQYPAGACIFDDSAALGRVNADGLVQSFASASMLRFDARRQTLSLRPLPAILRIAPADAGCAGA